MTTRKDQGRSQKEPCPLTTDASKRTAANKLAASVKNSFPAGLSQPALRALAAAGLKNLDQLTKVREADVAKLHGMGPTGIKTLREALKRNGQSFKS